MIERETSIQDCLKRLYEQDAKSPYWDRTRDGYTREEAEREIERIKKSKEQVFQFENGDGIHCITYTKEEMIELIKANINE